LSMFALAHSRKKSNTSMLLVPSIDCAVAEFLEVWYDAEHRTRH
jgi:hypothetical protein